MSRPSQSLFIEKLHDLLERPFDETGLRWVSDTAFEIIDDDVKARHSLSATWDFRFLSSFIRQLSYYDFKRLTDRRRSGKSRPTQATYIVFTHPTGFFIRGDDSKLSGIARKLRRPASKVVKPPRTEFAPLCPCPDKVHPRYTSSPYTRHQPYPQPQAYRHQQYYFPRGPPSHEEQWQRNPMAENAGYERAERWDDAKRMGDGNGDYLMKSTFEAGGHSNFSQSLPSTPITTYSLTPSPPGHYNASFAGVPSPPRTYNRHAPVERRESHSPPGHYNASFVGPPTPPVTYDNQTMVERREPQVYHGQPQQYYQNQPQPNHSHGQDLYRPTVVENQGSWIVESASNGDVEDERFC